MVKEQTVGVLAVQGGFSRHIEVLHSLGARTKEVKREEDLEDCTRLIIPGGESTVFSKFLTDETGRPNNFHSALTSFAQTHPVMGTCAGLILLCGASADPRVHPLGVLPVSVVRNGWGRQTESFVAQLDIAFTESEEKNTAPYEAVFIRAPRITGTGPGVRVLASVADSEGKAEPVMVSRGNIIGLTFHPELTPADTRIHEYFLHLKD